METALEPVNKSKKRQLTDMQVTFLNTLMGEAQGDYRSAMRIAGYSDNTPVREVVAALRDEIVDTAMAHLAMNAPKAAIKMTNLLDSPDSSGASNLLKAATEVLNRAGARPPEQVSISSPGGGLFILPAKNQKVSISISNEPDDITYEAAGEYIDITDYEIYDEE